MSNAAFNGAPYEPDPAQAPAPQRLVFTARSQNGVIDWQIGERAIRITRISIYAQATGPAAIYLFQDWQNQPVPIHFAFFAGTVLGERNEWSDPQNPMEVPAGGGIKINWEGSSSPDNYARIEYVEVN